MKILSGQFYEVLVNLLKCTPHHINSFIVYLSLTWRRTQWDPYDEETRNHKSRHLFFNSVILLSKTRKLDINIKTQGLRLSYMLKSRTEFYLDFSEQSINLQLFTLNDLSYIMCQTRIIHTIDTRQFRGFYDLMTYHLVVKITFMGDLVTKSPSPRRVGDRY